MIVKLIATDPRPRLDTKTDLVVYQVPENSREMQLLTELFDTHDIPWVLMPTSRKPKEKKHGTD